MFKLLRRISSSVYPRPDRPWSDDATSNAPTIGRKRRMSDEDEDMPDVGTTHKRRGQIQRENTAELSELGVKGKETDPAVKEVTQGVKEVELEEKKDETANDEEDTVETEDMGGEEATGEQVEASVSANVSEEDLKAIGDKSMSSTAVKEDSLPAAGSKSTHEEPTPKAATPAVDDPKGDEAVPASSDALSPSSTHSSSPSVSEDNAAKKAEEVPVVASAEVIAKEQESDTQAATMPTKE